MDVKELSKTIRKCDCKPYLIESEYCKNCTKTIIDFMNDRGAGVLLGELEIEELKKETTDINNTNKSLRAQLQKLQEKVRKLEDDRKRV